MFSLIVAIVSIALIVASVVAGGYYGGSAILDGRAHTEAMRIKNEEQQILAAADLFRAEHRRWPTDLNELLSSGNLRSAPRGLAADGTLTVFSLIPVAYAQSTAIGWKTPVASQPIYVTADTVPKRVCQQFNLASRGDNGILLTAYEALAAQCYGAQDNYRIVITKKGPDVMALKDALPDLVLAGGLPMADGGDAWWDTPPVGQVKAPIDPEKTPTALLMLSSPTFDFGLVPVGETSVARTLTLTNAGNRELTGLSGYAAPQGYAITNNTCTSTLAEGRSCSMGISFNPAAAERYEGSLTFSSSSPQTPSLALKGAGAQASLQCVGPAGGSCDITFGDVAVGEVAISGVLTLSNVGNHALSNLKLSLPPPGFAFVDSTCGEALESADSCRFKVSFKPLAMGDLSALMNVDKWSYTLAGRGTQVDLTSNLAWSQNIGAGPALANHYAQYILRNAGNLPVTLNSLTLADGAGFANVGNCVMGTALAPNATCAVNIGFPASQNASAALRVQAVLSTSAGDKTLTVSGSSAELQWNVVTAPPLLEAGQVVSYLLRLTNGAPTTFAFGGGSLADGKFTLTGADWSFISSSCGATLPPGGNCDVQLGLALTAAEVDRPVALTPMGELADYANRIEDRFGGTPAPHQIFRSTARAERVDYGSLIAHMTNPTFVQDAALDTLGAGYSLVQGGSKSLPLSTWTLGRAVSLAGTAPVKAKLRYAVDGVLTALKVNGKPVDVPTASSGLKESSEFTLTPGTNSVTFDYRSTAAQGAFAAQVIKIVDGSLIAGSAGWKYPGTPVKIPVVWDVSGYRYGDNATAESCAAYKAPAAGYAAATLDGVYRIKPGSTEKLAYCDQTHGGGGWTLVMTNNLPNFTNRAGTGTSTVCLTIAGCSTGGTSTIYNGTPVQAKIRDFMFTDTDDGNVFKHVNYLLSPQNFYRDTTPYPGISLYTLMTDDNLGWAPAANIGIPDGGDMNEQSRMFPDSVGHYWSDGNWWGTAGRQGMQLRSVAWGHHHYAGDPILEGTNYRVEPWTHLPYFGSPDVSYVSANAAHNLYRWTIFVR